MPACVRLLAASAVLALAASSVAAPRSRPAPSLSAAARAPRVDLDGGAASRRVPLGGLTLTCPDDLSVDCDGAGNLAERQGWLDSFTSAGGCAPVTTTLTTTPGVLVSGTAYPDFCDLTDFTLNGSAATIGNPVLTGGTCVLRLTNNLTQSGSAFLTNAISLASDASFSAYFTFQITNNMGIVDSADGIQGADGLVFVVQTVSSSAGGSGGGIGYQGIPNSVGIEFDTWFNAPWDDGDGNHAGIDLNGNIDSIIQVHVSPHFNDGAIWHAWVDYDGASDALSVSVNTTAVRPLSPTFGAIVDLPTVLGATDAYVGFTSGTGAAGGFHDIRSLVFNNSYVPIGCSGTGVETAVYTAADACGNVQSCQRAFSIVDVTPPAVTAGAIEPCYDTLADAEAAALAATTASDACDPGVRIDVASSGACDAVVDVTATDECGNAATVSYFTSVDTDAPAVVPPPDETVPCTAVPPPGSPLVSDACGTPGVVFDETRVDGPCPGQYELHRTWTATDDCLRVTSATQVITVVDTTPPTVVPGSALTECLWPPNHWMVCFDRDAIASGALVDDCSEPVTFRLTGCSSDQPENDVGDGDFAPDCVVAADGLSFCVRAERQGTEPGGRHYAVRAVATDACGNESAELVLGSVYVPHDQSPHEDCIKTTEVGFRVR